MLRLDRAAVVAPPCLSTYNYRTHIWKDVTPEHKQQIREHLEQMQGPRCAYCEGPLDSLGQHIEHFRRKQLFKAQTFDWANLYWSCDQTDSCGHYKDHGAGPYNANDLLEPCVHNTDEYFRFRSDGTISVRDGLPAAEKARAEETLRVFNLNPVFGRLRNMRKSAVAGYVSIVDGFRDFSPADMQTLLADELRETANSPFATAIRHVLTEL